MAMAYSMDLVCDVNYFTKGNEVLSWNAGSHMRAYGDAAVHRIEFEVFRITFKGKNMEECFTAVDKWRKSADGKFSMSIAFSEFGIDPDAKDKFYIRIWNEKTPKNK